MNETRRSPSGHALTMVLMISAVLATMAFAASALLPLGAEGLDNHEEIGLAQSLADGALEESLANLNAGRSPEFARDLTENGVAGSVRVRQMGKPESPDAVELLAVAHVTSSRIGHKDKPIEWHVNLRASVAKNANGSWSIKEYTALKQE